MENKEKFERFLKSHGAFGKYKRNVVDFNKFMGYIYSNKFVTCDAICSGENMISSAFPWVRTPEGREYWLDLDNLWRELVETKSK